jgi:prepilin signal peptidase PulO-like enzyme (type II secretory pathway)
LYFGLLRLATFRGDKGQEAIVNAGFFRGTNEFLIYVVFFALMLAATEAGFLLGRKSEASTPDKTKSRISVVEDAILGILALLLGFTMFMAVSRFDARKQLVLDEANAIGTSRLRAGLLPAPEGPEIASLLRQYIDVRVQYGTSGNDLARLESLNTQTMRLQNEFWTRAIAYAQKDADPIKTGLLLQSLNQVIDLESARRMAFQNPVPKSVIYVNCIVGLLASTLVGYTFGLSGRRQIFSTSVLALVITLVLGLIVDLDRPRSGFIRVSQQPMIDLQHLP